MSVISVSKLSSREGSRQSGNTQTWVDEYVVITDNPLDDPPFILASALLPQIGDDYNTERSSILGCVVKNVRLNHLDRDPMKWMARVEYSNVQGTDPQNEESPLDRAPSIGLRFERGQRVLERDIINNNAVTNSAKQPFTNPPVMVPKTDTIVTITRYLDAINLADIMAENDVVNSASFAGATSGQLLLNYSDARPVYEEGQAYWSVTFDIAFKKEGWNPVSVLDRGYVENAQGDRVFGLLDGSGNLSTNSTFLNYNGYDSLDFGALAHLDGVEELLS